MNGLIRFFIADAQPNAKSLVETRLFGMQNTNAQFLAVAAGFGRY